MPRDDIDELLSEYARKKVDEEADRQGVPRELARKIAQAESSFKPEVISGRKRSTAGAIGTMQLMPGTAQGEGVDPYDVDANISGGVSYLKKQLDTFKDPAKAAAAYNAGPGAVRKYGGVPPYQETQSYVKQVTGSADSDIDKLYADFNAPPDQQKPAPLPEQPLQPQGKLVKPANRPVKTQPLTENEKRYKQAANLINQIGGAKAEAVRLFQQSDQSNNQSFAKDSAGNPVTQRDALRAQAEGRLEHANRLVEVAQQRFGDLIEAGYGEDTDQTSNRVWAYAKPKQAFVEYYRNPSIQQRAAASTRADIDAELQQRRTQQQAQTAREQFAAQPAYQRYRQNAAMAMARAGEGVMQAGRNVLGLPVFSGTSAREQLSAVPAIKQGFEQGDIGRQATAERMAEREAAASDIESKIVRAVVGGAANLALLAPAAMTGGIPAVMGVTALQQDWGADPKGAAVATAGSAVPLLAGKAISPALQWAARGALSPVAKQAIVRGGEGIVGGVTGVGQYAGSQAILGRPIDTEEAMAQGITGAGLSAIMVGPRKQPVRHLQALPPLTSTAPEMNKPGTIPMRGTPQQTQVINLQRAQQQQPQATQPAQATTTAPEAEGLPVGMAADQLARIRARMGQPPAQAQNAQLKVYRSADEVPSELPKGRKLSTLKDNGDEYFVEHPASMSPRAAQLLAKKQITEPLPQTPQASAVEQMTPSTEDLPQVPETGRMPQAPIPNAPGTQTISVSPLDAFRNEADAAKVEAARMESEGRFADAAREYDAASKALVRLRRQMGKARTPEEAAAMSALDREINIAGSNKGKALQRARARSASPPPEQAEQAVQPMPVQEPITQKLPSTEQESRRPVEGERAASAQIQPATKTPMRPQEPASQQRVVTVDDKQITLTPEQAQRWEIEVDIPRREARERFDNAMRLADQAQDRVSAATIKDKANKDFKAAGMRLAAVKRGIVGRLTPKEEAARRKQQASNYSGKSVSVNDVNGTVLNTAFGKVRVKLDDGRIVTVPRDQVGKPVARPIQPQPITQEPTNRITEGEGGELQRYSRPLEGQPAEIPTQFTEYEGGELQRYSKPLEGQPVELPSRSEGQKGQKSVTQAKPSPADIARQRTSATPDTEAIGRRRELREAAYPGIFGKFSEAGHKRGTDEAMSLVEHPQLRRLLDLPPMPPYYADETRINPKTGRPYVNPEYQTAAQDTLNALAAIAGKERSSQMNYGQGDIGRGGQPSRGEMGDVYVKVAQLAKARGEQIDPTLKDAFQRTVTAARTSGSAYQDFIVDERIEHIRESLYDSYRQGQKPNQKALSAAFANVAEEYGLTRHYSDNLFKGTVAEAQARANRRRDRGEAPAEGGPPSGRGGLALVPDRGKPGEVAKPVSAKSEAPQTEIPPPTVALQDQPKPARTIAHTDFGDVTPAENQSGVPRGKQRVIDKQGEPHIIQRPTTGKGNRKAALAKPQPTAEAEQGTGKAKEPQTTSMRESWQIPRGELQGLRFNQSLRMSKEQFPAYNRYTKEHKQQILAEADRTFGQNARRAREETMRPFIEDARKEVDAIYGKGAFDLLTQNHREAVESAIKEGKPVPPEVLADYPDLQPQPGAQAKGGRKEPLPSDAYTEAKKLPNGTWQLFYRGTKNEVFPGETFHSASEAKRYLKVQRLKQSEAAPRPAAADIARERTGKGVEAEMVKESEAKPKPEAGDTVKFMAAGREVSEYVIRVDDKSGVVGVDHFGYKLIPINDILAVEKSSRNLRRAELERQREAEAEVYKSQRQIEKEAAQNDWRTAEYRTPELDAKAQTEYAKADKTIKKAKAEQAKIKPIPSGGYTQSAQSEYAKQQAKIDAAEALRKQAEEYAKKSKAPAAPTQQQSKPSAPADIARERTGKGAQEVKAPENQATPEEIPALREEIATLWDTYHRSEAEEAYQKITELEKRIPAKVVEPTQAEVERVANATKQTVDKRTGFTQAQENYLVDKLRDFTKQPEQEKTTIKVPGDGQFTVRNTEQANNLAFRLTGKTLDASKPTTGHGVKMPTKAPSLTTPANTGIRSGLAEPDALDSAYYPFEMHKTTPTSGWNGNLSVDKAYLTDGHTIIRGDATQDKRLQQRQPDAKTQATKKMGDEMWAQYTKKLQDAEIDGTIQAGRTAHVAITAGNVTAFCDADKLRRVMDATGADGVKLQAKGGAGGPVVVTKKGDPVAIIMPIRVDQEWQSTHLPELRATMQQGSSAAPPAKKRAPRSSFGKLPKEPSGEVMGAGFGSLQSLYDKWQAKKSDRKARAAEIEANVANRKNPPIPTDFKIDQWFKDTERTLAKGVKDGRLTENQVTDVLNEVEKMQDAIDADDGVAFAASKIRISNIVNPRIRPDNPKTPVKGRDVGKREYLRSPLSNLNYVGTYEKLGGQTGYQISEAIRQTQIDIGAGKYTSAEGARVLRSVVDPLKADLKQRGLPGLAEFVDAHIEALGKGQTPFSTTANFLKKANYDWRLRWNPRSTGVNALQSLQTLWPHVTTKEYGQLIRKALQPETRARLKDIIGREAGGKVEGIDDAKPRSFISDPFGKVSEFNRIMGHLAGEMFADRLGLTGEAKARMAADWNKKVEFDNSRYDVPPLFRGDLASVIGQFKPFTIKNLERLYSDWKRAAPGTSNPANWKGTLARRSKMVASQFVIGGVRSFQPPVVKSISGVLILGGLANALSKVMSEEAANTTAEAIYFGAPSLLGSDISTSVMLLDEPFGNTPEEKALNFLGGPTISTGVKLAKEGYNFAMAEDGRTSKEEKRENAALRIAKTATPYTKTAQTIYNIAQSKTPTMRLGGKDTPMTKTETAIYGAMGTPVRQSRYYEEADAYDWQRKLVGLKKKPKVRK